LDTKKRYRVSKKDTLKAQLTLVMWITLYLIKTEQVSKLTEIFKAKGIFRSHAKEIALWHKNNREKKYASKLNKMVTNEVDRFLKSRE